MDNPKQKNKSNPPLTNELSYNKDNYYIEIGTRINEIEQKLKLSKDRIFLLGNNIISSKKSKKTIVFDDIDILNDQCQIIISTLINNYKNINFILTCNDLNKINNYLQLEYINFMKEI